jgi:predicted hydrolase (HD superfamily)
MNKKEALDLLHQKMQNQNLRRHCYAVGAAMRALAEYFCKENKLSNEEKAEKACAELAEAWEIVGLLHDGDYEMTKDTPEKHTLLMHRWLSKKGETDKEILGAILSHNYAHTGQHAPKNKLEWSLYCCDELTGLIVAVALVKPDPSPHEASHFTKVSRDKSEGQVKKGKLSQVSVQSVMNKWNSKSFAAGVDRAQIEKCQEKLAIPLHDFIQIVLESMQNISEELGL